MKRALTTLLALAALALAAPAAMAHGGGGFGGGPGFGPEGGGGNEFGADVQSGDQAYAFDGKVVSVDTDAGTIQLKLSSYRPYGESGDSSSSDSQTVTIKTDGDTAIVRDGSEASMSDIQAGDGLHVVIVADAGSTQDEVLSNAAYLVRARSPQSLR